MFRKFRFALFLVLSLIPVYSQALGVGEIITRSALNETFEAEIKLLSIPPGGLDNMKVSLASEEVFASANVDRLFILSRLKFSPFLKENGESAIRVYSRKPISEPFLNFLIQIDWSEGRVVREFTVLLDVK